MGKYVETPLPQQEMPQIKACSAFPVLGGGQGYSLK